MSELLEQIKTLRAIVAAQRQEMHELRNRLQALTTELDRVKRPQPQTIQLEWLKP